MKYFLLILLFSSTVSCSKSSHQLLVASYGFTNEKTTSKGVESSLVAYNGSLKIFIDQEMNGDFVKADMTDNLLSDESTEASDMRFSYVFGKNGIYYLFAERGGSIYAWTSTDLDTWNALNSGNAVLDPMPNTVTATLWNVGADIDDSGIFHLFVESSQTDNAHACLTYFTGVKTGDSLDFNTSRPNDCYIQRAGNPFVKFLSGRGLLLVYGDESQGVWKASAGTIDLDGTFKKSTAFSIQYHDVHVCDPTMEEIDGNLYLSVSVDQKEIHTMQKKESFTQMFDSIESEK